MNKEIFLSQLPAPKETDEDWLKLMYERYIIPMISHLREKWGDKAELINLLTINKSHLGEYAGHLACYLRAIRPGRTILVPRYFGSGEKDFVLNELGLDAEIIRKRDFMDLAFEEGIVRGDIVIGDLPVLTVIRLNERGVETYAINDTYVPRSLRGQPVSANLLYSYGCTLWQVSAERVCFVLHQPSFSCYHNDGDSRDHNSKVEL